MLCINLISTDPFFNLAVDEYLLKSKKEDFLVLSVNNPSVIIGKHQVAHRESDTGFVTENRIPVIRRISGGGTVFHDEGNLNFSFILQSSQGKQVDFRKYTQPVIDFLSTLGIKVIFEGRNDLKIDGLKISGNAEHVYRDRVLHHGTLLFDSKLDRLRNSLRKDTSSYSTRAVQSNPSPVVNLSEKIPGMDMCRFRQSMMNYFLCIKGNASAGLKPAEIAAVKNLAGDKYITWEWNYAYGPEYTFKREFAVKGKPLRCQLTVKEGIIKECIIEGSDKMEHISKKLIGRRHMPEDIAVILNEEKIISPDLDICLFF